MKNKDKITAIRLNEDDQQTIENFAGDFDITKSAMIRYMLMFCLEWDDYGNRVMKSSFRQFVERCRSRPLFGT